MIIFGFEISYMDASLILAGATVLLAIVSIVIAVRSAKSSSSSARAQIGALKKDTLLNIQVENIKLDVEKFRISMHIMELKDRKEKLLSNPKQLDIACLMGPNGRETIKLIDAEIDRSDRLYKKIGFAQIEIQKVISQLQREL